MRLATLPMLFVLALASAAQAQDDDDLDNCDPTAGRGPLEITPASSATNVSLGASIRVLYTEGFFDDPAALEMAPSAVRLMVSETETPVEGEVDVLGDVLFFRPDQQLEPGTLYVGTALGIDFDLGLRFTTGSSFDLSPPVLGRIESASASAVGPTCGAPEGGHRVDVTFAPAIDDGPAGDIEYLLYLTRGPTVVAPQLRARVRNFPTSTVPMAFVLTDEEASAPICVSVVAVDGVGNVDANQEAECFDPIQGNYFEPLCSAGPLGKGALPPIFPLALLGVAFGLRAARRRRLSFVR